MLEDGRNGFLCSFGDTAQWIEKIEWMIKNPGKRDEMAICARQAYLEKFTMQEHINNVTGFLKELDAV
jgi:glycosyltransferase involved in cell wall biosynthesis